MKASELKAIGCGQWDEVDEDGRALMLFPYQWYDHIPNGYVLECISGDQEVFKAGETDNDYRYGCLAFGLRVPV